MDAIDTAKKNVHKDSVEPEGLKIEGYDFNEGVDFEKILDSYETMGMQGDNFFRAINIIKKMIEDNSFIYLGYTSNMVSSGMRDIFRYLAQHKKIDVMVTTAGGVEEDFIKCLGNFVLGDFGANGAELREKGVNRAGNVFIPNSRYCAFEDFLIPVLEEFYHRQKKTGEIVTPRELIWKLGEKIDKEESIYYWAWKNEIPVFCPAINDGAIGDVIYFFKSSHPDFKIDLSGDSWEMNNTTLGKEKIGVIVLGGGVIKHTILNANLFRDGADYGVFINHAIEQDGSDAGASPEEAVSWGKLMPNSERVKIFGDAILLFPLIVAKTFAKL